MPQIVARGCLRGVARRDGPTDGVQHARLLAVQAGLKSYERSQSRHWRHCEQASIPQRAGHAACLVNRRRRHHRAARSYSASPSTTASTRSSTKPMARPCAEGTRSATSGGFVEVGNAHHQGDDEAGGGDLSNLLAHGRNLQDLEARSCLRPVSVQHAKQRRRPATPSPQPRDGRGCAGCASAWTAAAYARNRRAVASASLSAAGRALRPARSRRCSALQAPSQQWPIRLAAPRRQGHAPQRAHAARTRDAGHRRARRAASAKGERRERTVQPTTCGRCTAVRVRRARRPNTRVMTASTPPPRAQPRLPRRTSGWRGGRPAQAPAGKRSRPPS